MNFLTWAKETSKLTNPRLPESVVKMVLYCAIKAVLDEFEANKEFADLNIQSIGRFYMNRRRVNLATLKEKCKGECGDEGYYWEIRFKPSGALKRCINGKQEYSKLALLKNKLFTDERVTLSYNFKVEKKQLKKIPAYDGKSTFRTNKHNWELKELLTREGIRLADLGSIIGVSYSTLLNELSHPLTKKNYIRIMKAIEVIRHERQQHIWR